MVGSRLTVVDHVAEVVAHFSLGLLELFELFLEIVAHFGVGLGSDSLLGLGDLVVEIEISAIGKRNLGERPSLLGKRRQSRAVGGHRGVNERGFEFEETLIVGLELFKQGEGSESSGDR